MDIYLPQIEIAAIPFIIFNCILVSFIICVFCCICLNSCVKSLYNKYMYEWNTKQYKIKIVNLPKIEGKVVPISEV